MSLALELWSRHAVERRFTPGGMEIAPSNSEYDLDRIQARIVDLFALHVFKYMHLADDFI